MISKIGFPRMSLHVLVAFMLFAGSACAYFSAEAQKERHLQRADEYFQAGKYREAQLEYRNVLEIDPGHVHSIARLGQALFEQGQVSEAFPILQKAKELDPENLDVRLKLGAIQVLGSRFEEAREEALYVLEQEPQSSQNLDALVLLGDAAQTPEEVQSVMARLEEVRPQYSDTAKFHLALGSLSI